MPPVAFMANSYCQSAEYKKTAKFFHVSDPSFFLGWEAKYVMTGMNMRLKVNGGLFGLGKHALDFCLPS